jgi:aminoglycoside phosphotransferase (APT) family kinase protein
MVSELSHSFRRGELPSPSGNVEMRAHNAERRGSYLRLSSSLPVFLTEVAMDSHELLCRLQKTGRTRSPEATAVPLAGGVSSEIWLVTDGSERFVVKRALPKLKVRDDWFADTTRNSVEHNCLAWLDQIASGSVPRILFHDAAAGLFAMEFLRFANWKDELLRGLVREEDAARAAKLMATIHAASWGDSEVQARFQTWPNFFALRVEPYLLVTGSRHPKLKSLFEEEAERLGRTSLALAHGDFSPKNILISPERLALLDCEAAWFGDPAFDAAFLLNHLFLKSLHLPAWRENYLRLVFVCWSNYSASLADRFDGGLSSRIGRLLLMLMLARIDGKSPVEYIVEEQKKELVRDFVGRMLPAGAFAMEEITDKWRRTLAMQ